MSKAVYVCSRSGSVQALDPDHLLRLGARINPENIVAHPTSLAADHQIIRAIYNPSDTLVVKNMCLLMGSIYGSSDGWDRTGSAPPDGTYALFRADKETFEAVTDALASRTIWYYLSDDVFIASTSQRAIVALLGSFSLNRDVLPWVLSSGCLGPGLSWDKRIRVVPCNARLRLDRCTWKVTIVSEVAPWKESTRSRRDHLRCLEKAMETTLSPAPAERGDWQLLLSGGYDSRAILLHLAQGDTWSPKTLKTLSWGLRSSMDDASNDAHIAKQLADHFGLPHIYHETDLSPSADAVGEVIRRFVAVGEGRSDSLAGYTDGFAIWKALHEQGVGGVIRGDEAFGWKHVTSERHVLSSVGAYRMSDYDNLPPAVQAAYPTQHWPDFLRRQEKETLAQWRDRLYHEFRVPVLLAALNDLKTGYVEIHNPLLARAVIGLVRTLPDRLRTDKRLLKEHVMMMSPAIPFASRVAIQEQTGILRHPDVVATVRRALSAEASRRLFCPALLDFVLSAMTVNAPAPICRTAKATCGSRCAAWLPSGMRRMASRAVRHFRDRCRIIDPNQLGFRAYMVVTMVDLLGADSIAHGHV